MKAWEERYCWAELARNWPSQYALWFSGLRDREKLQLLALRAHVADRQWRGI